MKASELIFNLQAMMFEHGDRDVKIDITPVADVRLNDDGDRSWFELTY